MLWRRSMGMTQAELADELDIAERTVRRWERRQTAIPGFLHLALDSLVLDLS